MSRFRRISAVCFEPAAWIRDRRYAIEYNHKVYSVFCPEYADGRGGRAIVKPDYIIPGRKYPAHVYLYAISLYSSNPGMSQRGAAEATREKFGLSKFSHSTLCRAFKGIEKLIKALGGESGCAGGANSGVSVQQNESAAPPPRRFPTAAGTEERRKGMETFIRRSFGYVGGDVARETGQRFAAFWLGGRKRLLN